MRKFISASSNKEYESFLKAIDEEPFGIDELDHQSLLNFLIFGSLNFDDTFHSGIKKRFSHQVYSLDKRNGLTLEMPQSDNPLKTEIVNNSVESFLEFFEDRISHLKNRRITLDLTGGIDSRLVASILHYYDVDFDAAFSLNSGDLKEAEIAKKVADILGVELHILESDASIDQEELSQLFKLSDGLWDYLGLKYLKQNQAWRKQQNYDLVITGVGGELYKDFWWQQDFPLYNKKQTDLKRLISMRMYPVKIKQEWLGEKIKLSLEYFWASFEERLKVHVKETNTKTYDQIYYHVRIKEQVSHLSHVTSNYLETYSPLLEPELLKIGYNLPRKRRFFNQFHREVITKVNAEVAKIETTEGNMTVSNKITDKWSDLGNYGQHKVKSLMKKINNQKTNNIQETFPFDQEVQELYREALDVLKNSGLISDKIPEDYLEIPKNIVGRLLTISEVVKRIS
jgi:hypothetical protein